MSETNVDVRMDPDITREGEPADTRAALATVEDRLPTTRLPPIAPPPMRAPSLSPPPFGSGAVSSRNTPTVPPQSGRAGLEARVSLPPETIQPPKPSWFRALLTTTSPPPATVALELIAVRRMVAVGCVVAACAFAVIALLFAFRAAPYLETMQPLVAATVVLTRALLAIGAGALTYGLLRIAERLSSERAMIGAGGGYDGSPD